MADASAIPPLPPGFTLDAQPQGSLPPLPPGFTLDQAPKDTSYGSALQEGAHDALSGLGATTSVIAHDVGWKGADNAGKWLQNAIPAPANYQSAGGDMVAKLKAGKILGALGDIPRAAVEGAPAVLGGLGAAAATPEVLGGAAVGAGLAGAGMAFGQDAQARAAANGHAQPTAGDQLAAGATAVGQGALTSLGLGKVPGVSAVMKALPAVAKAPASAVLDAAGQGASNVVGQVGTTAGTKQGLTVDPAQAGAAALQAAAARGIGKAASQTGGLVKDAAGAGLSAVGTKLATADLPPMTDEQAASYTRINNMMQTVGAQSASQRSGSNATNQLNGIWKQLPTQLAQVGQAALQTGQIDKPTYQAFRSALQQAQTHKSAMPGTAPGEAFQSAFGAISTADIDPRLKQTLTQGLTDLDNVSQMVNYKQATGPFATLGAKYATGLTAAGLLATGHPIDAGMVAFGGHATGIPGVVGQALGSVLDRKLGTAQPPVTLLRAQALKQAQAAGYDTTGNTGSNISDAYNVLRTSANQQAAEQAAQAEAVKANQPDPATQAAQRQAYQTLATLGPNHPAGAAALPMLPPEQAAQATSLFNQTQPIRDGKATAAANGQLDKAYGQAQTADFVRDQQIAQRGANLNEAAANTLSGQDYKNSEDGIIARANMAVRKKDILTQAATDGRLQQPMNQDEIDRVSIGLPPRDPIHVNVPLDANNQPLQQGTPAAQPRPQVTAPPVQQPQPQVPPQAAPGGPQAAGQPGLAGWQAHLGHVLWQRGVPTTPETIPNAVHNAVKSGALSPDMASSYMAQPQGFLGDRHPDFQTIATQAMLDHGMTPPAPAAPDLPPIRHPLRWQAAGANYQALGGSLQNMAASENDLPLAITIARIMSTSSAQQKVDIANQEFAERQHDVLALARAKQLIPPELLKGK